MGEWTDFAVVVGGASAALTGLLFVAISINVRPIGRSIGLRSRGAQTLVLGGGVADRGWGLLTTIRLPGGGSLGLYQPRHPVAAG